MRPYRLTSSALVITAMIASSLALTGSAIGQPTPLTTDRLSTADRTAGAAQVVVNRRGDAAAVWTETGDADGVYTVVRTRRAGQPWSAPTSLTDPADAATASDPAIALSDNGSAAVVWLSDGTDGRRVMASYGTSSGWTTPVEASTRGVTTQAPDVAIDGSGTVQAVWVRRNVGHDLVEAAEFSPATGWGKHRFLSLTGKDAASARIDVSSGGRAVAVWTQHFLDGTTTIRARERLTADAGWGAPLRVSKPLTTGTALEVDVDVEGGWSIAVWRDGTPAGPWTLYSNILDPAKSWGRARPIATTESADMPRAMIDGRGGALAVWTKQVGTKQYIARADSTAGRRWMPGTPLSHPSVVAHEPGLGLGASGHAIVTWTIASTTSINFATRTPGGAWNTSHGQLSSIGGFAAASAVAVDRGGNATAVWVDDVDGAAPPAVAAAILDGGAPVFTMTRPASPNTRVFPVRWSARDVWSGVSGYDVRVRSAKLAGRFGAWRGWTNGTSATSRRFIGQPGQTYCFSGRARDTFGNVSGWSAPLCTATPVDDRRLQAGPGWHRTSSPASYQKSLMTTSRKGAELRLRGVSTKGLTLVATTCRSCGKVSVSLGKQRLRVVNLRSGTTKTRVSIPVRGFPKLRTGTVTIKVASKGKRVLIDGLVVRRV